MKVTIQSFPNGYLIDTDNGRAKVDTVEWEGVPVEIEELTIHGNVEIVGETAYLEL